jgi:hypothetical protein
VFFLFGEKLKLVTREQDEFDCVVCNTRQRYTRFEEYNYFTVFLIAVAPISKVSNYCECSVCGSAYRPENLTIPSYLAPVHRTLVYIMMGYGMEKHMDIISELNEKITGRSLGREEIRSEIKEVNRQQGDIFETIRQHAPYLNIQGKRKVIEAAFLMTYVSCEIAFEDRLRVNLIGDALGTPLEFTEFVINSIRESGYYGVKRRLLSPAS